MLNSDLSDFTGVDMTLFISTGETFVRINVIILDNNVQEGDEIFMAFLTNPTNGLSLGDEATATISIIDNDCKQ